MIIIYFNLIDTSKEFKQLEEYFIIYRISLFRLIANYSKIKYQISRKFKYKSVIILVPQDINKINKSISNQQIKDDLIKLHKQITKYYKQFIKIIRYINYNLNIIQYYDDYKQINSLRILNNKLKLFIEDNNKSIKLSNANDVIQLINEYNNKNQ